MLKKLLASSTLAFAVALAAPITAGAQPGGNNGGSEAAAENAPEKAERTAEKAERTAEKAAERAERVEGRAGNIGIDQAGQNSGVGRGQAVGQGPGRQGTGQANFGNVVSALNNVSAQVQNVQALNNVNVVDVVDVNGVLSGNNVQALNNALNRNEVEILELQNVLNDNEVIKNALNDLNVAITDVVAVNVLSGGDIVVFTR
ncbi:hypothetical protein ACUN0C_04855 [Faunimonas sp. B44]|uniref:hypothetical protein n=1 Tax=Faunimonas sp. B44 TaxID=3461493 RepID=UPI0040446DAE